MTYLNGFYETSSEIVQSIEGATSFKGDEAKETSRTESLDDAETR